MEFKCRGDSVLVKWRGVSFHSWKLSSYSRFIQENWRLAIFVFISTVVRPPAAKELHRVLCLIFGVNRFQRNFFCLFSISSIICFGTTDVKHKLNILDKATVLKTIILPSKIKFLMRHILRTLWMFDIAVKKFFFMLSFIIVWKMNSENLDGIYSWWYYHRLLFRPLSGTQFQQFHT